MKILSSPIICDECNLTINHIEEGWVEWIDDNISIYDVRVVHNSKYSPTGNCSKHSLHYHGKSHHLEFILSSNELKNMLKIA